MLPSKDLIILQEITYLKDVETLSNDLSELLYYFYLAGFFSDEENCGDTGILGSELKKVESGKFTSKELDEETGLYYFGARYLDPQTSRWMSADPALGKYLDSKVGEGGIYNSINLSMYHYAGNNPLNYSDPTGMFQLNNTALTDDQKKAIRNTINTNWDNNQFVDDSGVRWFKQGVFDNVLTIGSGVDNTGCNLTTNTNDLSQEYTSQTGLPMSKDQLANLVINEYNSNVINSNGWLALEPEGFLNKGNETLGLKGQWESANPVPIVLQRPRRNSNNNILNTTITTSKEYTNITRTTSSGGTHFVNGSTPNIKGWASPFFDVYYGNQDKVISGTNAGIYKVKITRPLF